MLRNFKKVSVSQVSQYRACPRAWYVRNRVGLRATDTFKQARGTVLHAVIERFLLGQDPYPPNWFTADGHSIPTADRQMVVEMVNEAIELGYLARTPNQQVEFAFDGIEVVPGIEFVGKIDHWPRPDRIIDQKTSTSIKWLMSGRPGTQKYLGNDLQALTYAAVAKQLTGEQRIELIHNQFVFDRAEKKRVRKIECFVDAPTIDREWESFQGTVQEMKRLADSKEDNWRKVHGPVDKGACDAYGGCPYKEACFLGKSDQDLARQWNLDPEKVHFANQNHPASTSTPTPNTMTQPQTSSPFANALAAVTGQAAPAAPAQPVTAAAPGTVLGVAPAAPAPAAPVPAAPAPAPAPPLKMTPQEQQAHLTKADAPWAYPGCPACGKSDRKGYNAQGNPCNQCDHLQSEVNGLRPHGYEFEADGTVKPLEGWGEAHAYYMGLRPEAAAAPTGQAAPQAPAPAPEKEKEAPKQKKRGPGRPKKSESAPQAAPTAAPAAATSDEIDAPAQKRKGSLHLYVNCSLVKGPKTQTWSEVLKTYGDMLATSSGKQEGGYFALEAFSRRDALAGAAEWIVDQLGTCSIHGSVESPDLKALAEALMPFAKTVVMA